jgi:hypothetical protein
VLPPLRRPIMRPSQGAINSDRMVNREAFLAQAVGAVAPRACRRCARSNGPWTLCVVATGYLSDSCANCHYGSTGHKCSFRLPSK